tara:strand:- start:9445 stop:10719 length:1275 start_codon:yes stop_codon:yes gene_type:complete
MISVKIDTHGCKLNQADSIQLYKKFIQNGFNVNSNLDNPDIYILNSCTVTHVADKKARKSLRKIKKDNPSTLTVLTGCYAERDKENIIKSKIADLVYGNFQKDNLIKDISNHLGYQLPPIDNPIKTGNLLDRTRASVKIQEGCNQICAYCIVPKVRGREKSIDKRLITNEINDLHERGYKEIVLTGTQLGTYGFDLKNENLETLIKFIMTETSIERLRISSIQAHEISEDLLEIYRQYSQRICNHFHLALQSGSNKILNLMRRKYDNNNYLKAINLIKSNLINPSISTDVIVGFPGETERDFNDSLKIIKSSKFSKIHLFPYSDRPGTSSYYFKDKIKPEIKKKRMNIALKLANNEESAYRLNVINQKRNILWEKPLNSTPTKFEGYSEDYLRVQIESKENLYNKITPVILKKLDKDYIISEIL